MRDARRSSAGYAGATDPFGGRFGRGAKPPSEETPHGWENVGAKAAKVLWVILG